VSQLFLRADELANIIYEVKLLISEWKVLFALDGEMDSIQLSEFLELEKDQVEEALKNLNNLNLIKVIDDESKTTGVQAEPEELPEIEFPLEEEQKLAEEIDEELTEQEEIPEEPVGKERDDFSFDLGPLMEEKEDELAEEKLLEEKEETDFELPEDELEESKAFSGDDQEFSQKKEAKEETEEDLDELINDLLKEDTEETVEDKSSVSPGLETEEKIEAKPEKEESAIIEEEQEDFDLGEIFETDLEETEQSLDEMLDTIDTKTDFEIEKGKDVLPDAEVSQKTILVVDDSVVIRKMVEIALENENYNIVSVANGKDALSYLDEKEPNMVILDIMLPDVNGLDILKAIRASKDIPVVMLSAKDTPRETSKAKELGANDFIPKPFKDEELINKIHELIGE
jgi:CheY-like chemotaxis protein